jgi:hypothetical protein
MMRLVVDMSLFLWVVAALLTTVVTAQQGESVHYTCAFTALQLDRDVVLEHVKNQDEGTYTMRLTYTGGLGWVAIGVNSDGGTNMVPATAVIGRVEYDVDGM